MSHLRNHRVVIASLFLPTTAVIGESNPPSPDPGFTGAGPLSPAPVAVPAPASPPPERPPFQHKHSRSLGGNPPLKSIVEDLKSRQSRAITPISTPGSEGSNPFSKFASLTAQTDEAVTLATGLSETPMNPIGPPRKFQTTHPDTSHVSRLQRKHPRAPSAMATAARNSSASDDGMVEVPWHTESNSHCNGGLKNAIDAVRDRLSDKMWVGTLGTKTDDFSDVLRKDVDMRMSEGWKSVPVWIPDNEFESCYDEFCHQVLWPALHYAVPDAPKTKLFYESGSFKQYQAVNQRFADVIIANYKEGDIIWVNDYHLMLLPALLRASPVTRDAPIGFFMHVAFPSSEIFRCLAVREPLLRGLLGADLVGFQTANFARHFRQTVSRILALESLPKGVQVEAQSEAEGATSGSEAVNGHGERGRFVEVGVFPMGIDVGALREKKRQPDVEYWVQLLKQRYAGMKLVVGRDKLDEIQGVRHKLEAFAHFLKKHPESQGKVVLIQVALQTTESNELAGGVSDVVARVNSQFSTLTYQPIVFLHTQDLTFSQYLALLTVADAFLVTSLREGMALRTHEFVECQEGRHRPLILSEFTGSYSYSGFRSCIAVNPWDTRGTGDAINRALSMGDEEARERWVDLHNHVVTQTAQAFVTSFLARCLRAHTEHLASQHSSSTSSSTVQHPSPLDVSRLLPRYKYSSRRLLLFDLEGTLWLRDMSRAALQAPFTGLPEGPVNVLRRLVKDARNEVWVLSGLQAKGVLDKVAEAVPGVGVVAENGCFIRTRGTRREPAEWVSMLGSFNMTWKGPCVEILNYFTERTPGAFVEEREASVVWRFWSGAKDENCPDRQWARRQAAEAQNHIFDSLGERYGLRIIPGANSFLVLPNNISRSTAVGAILHPGGPARSPAVAPRSAWLSPATNAFGGGDDLGEVGMGDEASFVLAVSSDEKLLRRLNDLEGAETCSTSGKGTDAKWRLDARESVVALEQFANASA
ncbi:glycosyltransferase family 20 protein [Coniophora puteana RWD-64-598 SS2]|uniref:Glycosyltransferase family 20 protein n=1 Tax=Coniophora puteana (strain RWD-64-598) TaxID=741705 RepID=A0A5M3M7B7_CONPW|nr:glycosyltransferase family 20 protein [Coniophora puteana RWD-64-598 SS2]EIW74943.1 glycosyltransferase family 20 protein [Coniophora puteana RWD-64-598 SS2]